MTDCPENQGDENSENYKEANVHFNSLNTQNQSQYIWDMIMNKHGYRSKYDDPVVQVVTLKKILIIVSPVCLV